VSFPNNTETPLRHFVKEMCAPQAADRLPMKKGGSANIKAHEFYDGFDWDAMKSQTLRPPYVPIVKSRTDIANFKVSEEEKPPQVEYKPNGDEWDEEFATCSFHNPNPNKV